MSANTANIMTRPTANMSETHRMLLIQQKCSNSKALSQSKSTPEEQRIQSYPCYICKFQSKDKDETLKHLHISHDVDIESMSSKARENKSIDDSLANRGKTTIGKPQLIRVLPKAQNLNEQIQRKSSNNVEKACASAKKSHTNINANKKKIVQPIIAQALAEIKDIPRLRREKAVAYIYKETPITAVLSNIKVENKKSYANRGSSTSAHKGNQRIKNPMLNTGQSTGISQDELDRKKGYRNESNTKDFTEKNPKPSPKAHMSQNEALASETSAGMPIEISTIPLPVGKGPNKGFNTISIRSFPCYLCKFSAVERETLLFHLKDCHDVDTEAIISKKKRKATGDEPLIQEKTNKKQTASDTEGLLQSKNIAINSTEPKKTYPCYMCKHQSLNRYNMLKHLETTHAVDTQSILSQTPVKKVNREKASINSLMENKGSETLCTTCIICGFNTSSQSALVDHIKSQHEANCDNRTKSPTLLQKTNNDMQPNSHANDQSLQLENINSNSTKKSVHIIKSNNRNLSTSVEGINIIMNEDGNTTPDNREKNRILENANINEICHEERELFQSEKSLIKDVTNSVKPPTVETNSETPHQGGNFPCYMCEDTFDAIQDMVDHLLDDHQITPKSKKPSVPDRKTDASLILENRDEPKFTEKLPRNEGREKNHNATFMDFNHASSPKQCTSTSNIDVAEITNDNFEIGTSQNGTETMVDKGTENGQFLEIYESVMFMLEEENQRFNQALGTHDSLGHDDMHQQTEWLICNLCNQTYPTNFQLQAHKIMDHDRTELFACILCSTLYSSQIELDTHDGTAHP